MTIEELKSLIKIVSKNKVKQIEVVGEKKDHGTQVQRLYDLISDDEVKTDEEAINFFYSNSQHNRTYFNRLKKKLERRLLNTLFFIDINQPNFTEIQKAYYSCYKNTTAVKILIGRGARKAAITLAEKTIKKSLKFEFTDITLELARSLQLHFSHIDGNRKKYRQYKDLIKKHSKVFEAELLSEEYLCDLVIYFASSQSTKPELIETAEAYAKELREIIKVHNSYKLNLNSYLIFALRFEIRNDYYNTLAICKEAIDFFNSKPHIASRPVIFNFSLRRLACNIILGDFNEGEKAAKKCMSLQTKGSINWFLTMDYFIILLFHHSKFQVAYDRYLEVIDELDISGPMHVSLERWKIYEAFLHFLIAIGKINRVRENDRHNFRLSKFLNEVPKFSKDKEGVNIQILIIQILFLLYQQKYGQIIDRTESLKTYVHRYLRRDGTFRSNCFIKMLLCLPAASFHKAGVARKAKKYIELLDSVPIQEANQSPEVEIIPYKTLWGFVLESLDNKFHNT